ncbi:hypothetical protein C7S18_08270 [Ahniella affigens]|uniref:Uncharacterized protein n=1 Tax=Ahniella affigens TaxID=2021234 RepID=A0A2P1PQS2_9GAMM|nr:hypothetical protein [Ahniella affigens]AVP97189.1 hypothetical protein C7S18_08270 [Ahniella affigens]
MSTVQVSSEQKYLVSRLSALATKQLNVLTQISGAKPNGLTNQALPTESYEKLKAPRKPNALGIFGRRGSGKTTILTEVIDQLHGRRAEHGWHVLTLPLDLSMAPREFPHGLTLVHWLHARLAEHTDACKPRCGKLDASFEKVAQSYFRGSNGFNQLVRKLALSPEHYAGAAAKEIGARLTLHQDIGAWLDQEARFRGVDGFVLALDDVDLPPANRHHSLIWSLLDELHQDRLFLIMAGDLQRLETRLTEEDASVRRGSKISDKDPQAAQDLIYKVLPQANRIELPPWPAKDRLNFPPAKASTGRVASEVTIKALLDKISVPSVLREHLPALLPPWARGLENVWRELSFRSSILEAEAVDSDAQELKRELGEDWSGILTFLLESRFEFELASQLKDPLSLQDFAPSFRWQLASADHSYLWRQLRDRMQWNRAKSDEDFWSKDIPELVPEAQDRGLRLLPSHGRLAEALIDFALYRNTLTPERLVSRIPWLRAHYEHCKATVLRDLSTMDRDRSDSPLPAAAALHWIDLASDNYTAQIGFWPVMALQLGERRKLTKAMADFQPTGLAALAAAGADEELKKDFLNLTKGQVGELLPYRNCRMILQMADALALQPWNLLESVSARVSYVGLARLAAMLTYCAHWTAAHGNLKRRPCLDEVINKNHRAPESLSESSISQDFKSVLDEASDIAIVKDNSIHHGVGLLVNAPWFRGLA